MLVPGGSTAANFSDHFSAEKARCVEVFHISSEWFDYTEPSRTTSSQGNKVCRVLFEPHLHKGIKVCMRLSHPELAHRYPTHPVPPVKRQVRYSRTTPNSCEREGSSRFAVVESPGTSVWVPYTPCSPVKMRFEKVRYSRTTKNSCERPLHTLLSLY